MTLKKIHFLKDRFIFDDYESGLYFDVCPVKRPAGDEAAFNTVIETAASGIVETQPANQNWKPTLLLTDAQVYDLPESWRKVFAPKTYLMLFKSGFTGDKLPSNLWFEYGSGGIVCNPTGAHADWLYYTNYTADGLGHRFRRVSKEEVDAYQYTEPSSGSADTTTDDSSDTPDSTTLTAVSGGLFPLNSKTTITGSILSKGDEPVVITVEPLETE